MLVLRNAWEITVEERPLALEMCLNGYGDCPENTAGKRLIFTSKWTTAWHHGVVHALLNTHLPSFDSPIAMKEQRPSSETPAWRSGDRPKNSKKQPKNGHFWTLNRP